MSKNDGTPRIYLSSSFSNTWYCWLPSPLLSSPLILSLFYLSFPDAFSANFPHSIPFCFASNLSPPSQCLPLSSASWVFISTPLTPHVLLQWFCPLPANGSQSNLCNLDLSSELQTSICITSTSNSSCPNPNTMMSQSSSPFLSPIIVNDTTTNQPSKRLRHHPWFSPHVLTQPLINYLLPILLHPTVSFFATHWGFCSVLKIPSTFLHPCFCTCSFLYL